MKPFRLSVIAPTVILLCLAFIAVLPLRSEVSHVHVNFDGPQGGSISDHALEAQWTMRNGRPIALTVRNLANAQSIELTGPFRLVLGNGQVIDPSRMSLEGAPMVETLQPVSTATIAAKRLGGKAVHLRLSGPEGRFAVDWTLEMRSGAHYIRQIVTITAAKEDVEIVRLTMVDAIAPNIAIAGSAKGSPMAAEDFFMGLEHPLARSSVVASHGLSEIERVLPLRAHQSVTYSSVVGVAAPGQMRRDFLAYIEQERAHPYRTFLHYNSWYDIGFFNPYTQQEALDRIHTFGEQLHTARGVTLDSFLFDDGWDDHRGMWAIRQDFKDGFLPLKQEAAKYGTAPGVWLSPWGGYGKPKQERVEEGEHQGYEVIDGGFALSGPKYYARFHDAAMEMVKRHDVNQFKFDGTGNADGVFKGSTFDSDFDAAIHLIGDLRQAKPDLFINLTTGTYPSPFWLLYADSIWRGGEDHSFAGVGSWREKWITYRDAATYNYILKAGPLFPLNSLMLHGLIYAQRAEHLDTDPGNDFKNEVHDYFGTGTQLQEMYITPSLLKPSDWDTIAEAAKWSRANAKVLKDTHWVGGDPQWLEVYGWAAWTPAKAILTLRNPSDREQTFSVDVGKCFELPKSAATWYRASSPWLDERSAPTITFEAGKLNPIVLKPFQVLTLEAVPESSPLR